MRGWYGMIGWWAQVSGDRRVRANPVHRWPTRLDLVEGTLRGERFIARYENSRFGRLQLAGDAWKMRHPVQALGHLFMVLVSHGPFRRGPWLNDLDFRV